MALSVASSLSTVPAGLSSSGDLLSPAQPSRLHHHLESMLGREAWMGLRLILPYLITNFVISLSSPPMAMSDSACLSLWESLSLSRPMKTSSFLQVIIEIMTAMLLHLDSLLSPFNLIALWTSQHQSRQHWRRIFNRQDVGLLSSSSRISSPSVSSVSKRPKRSLQSPVTSRHSSCHSRQSGEIIEEPLKD